MFIGRRNHNSSNNNNNMKNDRRRRKVSSNSALLIEDDMDVIVKLLRRKSSKLLGSNRKSQSNLQDSDGMSSLHQAALMGNMQILNMLLEIGVNLDQTDNKGMTALHYASWQNTPDTASLLLQRGAKIDLCNNDGSTALHIACQHGQIDVISLLIYYRADPTIRNRHGLTPFDVACEYGRLKTVEVLLDTGLCKRLLFAHDEGTKDTSGVSPLHLASKNGHIDVVRLLLESGCDINYKLRHGTPLHDAASTCRVETVKLLIHAGADVHATNNNCQTPLDLVKKVTNKNDPAAQNVILLLQEAQKAIYTKAICDYCAQNEDELSFNYGDVIWVTNQTDDTRWKGVIFGPKYTSRSGYFPQTAVQLIDKKAGMIRLANQRHVKKVGVPIVPDVKYDTVLTTGPFNGNLADNDSRQQAVVACDNNNATSSLINNNSSNNNNNNSNNTDTMKSSRSTFLSSVKNRNTSTFSAAAMPSSVSAYSFPHFQQPLLKNGDVKQPSDSSSGSSYNTPRNDGGGIIPITNSPSQHRMSSSSTTSSQTSSGFESMKNGSNSLSNAAVHQLRNFNSPSRSSMHSNGSSSLGSLEKLDEFICGNNVGNNNGRINVAEMVLNGVPEDEILSIWLHSLRYEEYLNLFLNAGYDLETVVRMTPEDLTAIGITKPGHRKRLTAEIRKLNVTDSWPSRKPATIHEWLFALSLPQYVHWFVAQGLTSVDQIMQLTWEDFEDIGVKKLGHLKKLVCAVKKLKDNQQQQNQNDAYHRTQTPIVNLVNSSSNNSGVSEILLINVPATPRHVGEIRPYYHSPQSQHRMVPSSSTMRTFQQLQNNKCQDQQNVWRQEMENGGHGLSASPSSIRSHLNNPATINGRRHFSQEHVIYEEDAGSLQADRGCATFALWRDCAGSATPTRLRHDSGGGARNGGHAQVRYTTSDAILHQPDRPKVVVRPCPPAMTNSTSSLEIDNGNPKLSTHLTPYCRTAVDIDFDIIQQEQIADAAYAFCESQFGVRPHTQSVSSNLLTEPLDYHRQSLNRVCLSDRSVDYYNRYLPPRNNISEPNHHYPTYSINHPAHQGLIIDDRCFLQPSSISSSVFQLSPQPYFDDPSSAELSPANSVDDFPPPLRPISCEDQIRNLCFLQKPASDKEIANGDDAKIAVKPITHSSQTNPLSHPTPAKHVTFVNCPPPRCESSNSNNNVAQALTACSLDNNYCSNNYIDNLPFANENVGTIKGKSTSNVVNGLPQSYSNSRKTISEIFNPDPTCTGNQTSDVLGDIGDMLQDLTDQLDALLIQRSAVTNQLQNNCA